MTDVLKMCRLGERGKEPGREKAMLVFNLISPCELVKGGGARLISHARKFCP